jgi:ABC-2 type transport system ATP-binding protein
MTMGDYMLEARALTKSFGGRAVLRAIDLEVPRGSIFGLLGKNGAGKTTLIKCALGLLRVDSGEVRLLGESSWTLSGAAKARIGYVPQQITSAFYRSWNKEFVDQLLGRLELRDEGRRVGTLSAGETQKLALVLALGHEPEALLLDEPAANLDPAARREFLSLVLEIATGTGRTVVLSTHLTQDLERIADRVAILRDGRVEYVGPLDDLKDEVKQLRLSVAKPLSERFVLPGLLRMERDGNAALLSVRGFSPALVSEIERQWDASVEVRDLSLEDIFVELHSLHGNERGA